jgi:aarF domain-containing kinase
MPPMSTLERGSKHAVLEEVKRRFQAWAVCAQVHKAVLKKSGPVRIKGRGGGQAVAVKVRHPGVSEIIRRDFVIMNYCAQLCSTLPGLKWMRLDESVAQFAVFMLEQVRGGGGSASCLL